MTWRYKFAFITFVLAFLVVAFRLFYWQVVRASYLSEIGRNQYGQEIKVFPERGEILTSDLFPIATNKVSYLLFANPKEVTNKEDVALRVAKILDTEYASVSVSLSLDKFWVPIKPGLNEEKKEAIENLKIPGLGFEENYERFYPEASLAASLLGFVGKDDEGKDKGYFGLEGYYNRLLSGKEGSAIQIHDALGKPVIARLKEEGGALEGSDLILSIDRSIQFLVEKKLSDAVEKYGAQGGMVGVIDPKTGKIIALSSFPTFDPKKYYEYSQDLYKNAFISDLYEPGSTFKPLVMSAALNERKVTPATR